MSGFVPLVLNLALGFINEPRLPEFSTWAAKFLQWNKPGIAVVPNPTQRVGLRPTKYAHLPEAYGSYPRCVWAATGIYIYSSPLVCLYVTCESTHLDTIALRLQHR